MSGFLVFCGETYYPGGGWLDFVAWADSLEAAHALMPEMAAYGWGHIVDAATREIVWEAGDDDKEPAKPTPEWLRGAATTTTITGLASVGDLPAAEDDDERFAL